MLQVTYLVWDGKRAGLAVRWEVSWQEGYESRWWRGVGEGVRSRQSSKVTHHVVLQGDRRVCGHKTCLQVCQYNDSLNFPHNTLTDHCRIYANKND